MEGTPIPPGLVEQVPQLVVMVLVVAAILGFMWKIWQSQAGLVKEIVHRHESMEQEQMTVLENNNRVIDQKVEVLRHLDGTIGRFGEEIRRLAERIDPPIFTPPGDHMTHSIASPPAEEQPHIGVPGGVFDPPVTYSLSAIQQAGETGAWTIGRYGIDKLHAAGVKGKGGQVVVIDTGVDAGHPDLKPNTDLTNSRSFVPGQSVADGNGHGSHCGGIVAADDNGVGVVGVAPDATVTHMKGLSNQGSGGDGGLASAIRAAADLPGHRILSMSFGSSQQSAAITAAIRYAKGKGHWLVAAAGNAGPGSVNWPGALPEVICVGALDQNDRVANFSSANDFVDVGFGGVQILSTIPGGRYAPMDGTSMACPGVAGLLALAAGELVRLGVQRMPDQDEVTEVLYSCCRDVGRPGRDPGAGYGLPEPAKFVGEMTRRFAPAVPPKPGEPTPAEVYLEFADLTPDAKARLGGQGVKGFKLTIEVVA